MNTKFNVSEMIEGFVEDSIFDEIKTLHKESKILDEIVEDLPECSFNCKETMLSVKAKNEKRIEELYKQLHKKGVFVQDEVIQ